MINYPVGAENDLNAPFNKKELQGETIGLFEYLENLEMPFEVRSELNLFLHKLKCVRESLYHVEKSFKDEDRPAAANLINLIQKQISEPQIFIENE